MLEQQSFKYFEIIISDDSNDEEIKNLCKIWSNRLKIKHFFNKKHSYNSHSPNINNSLINCNGKWVKILFQDDFLYDSNSLKLQYDFINKNNNLNWFFTKFYHSYDGKNLYNLYSPSWNNSVWSGHNTLGGPSGLTLKNQNIPKFDENLIWLMDCDFYQKLFLIHGEPLICDSITVINRTSPDQLTTTISENIKINDINIVTKKYA